MVIIIGSTLMSAIPGEDYLIIVDLELSTYMDPLALSAEIDFRLGSVTLDP